jgi:AraC family transcriptional regulator
LRRARAGGVHAGLGVESVVLELLARASDGSARAETRRPRWLDRVTEALEARPFQRWTIRRLAAEVGVHPVHLSRTFRRFERRGVGGLAREVRIRAACRLLLDERVPITDVSILAGFSDQSHFTRVFRAVTGLPPGELRRLLG